MRVQTIPQYCLGCGLCLVYCAAAHDGYNGNVIKAFKKGNPLARASLIHRNNDSWLNICKHCQDAPCVNACITGALQKDEQGIVYVEKERCVACYTCLMVCPYGHIQPGSESSSVVKCDLCRDHHGHPACITFCPNGALRLIEEENQP